MVIPAPGFDPAATLRAVQDERCTSLYGVPTMFIAELGLPDFTDYELGSLRTGIMAGAACPVEVMRKVISRMHMPGSRSAMERPKRHRFPRRRAPTTRWIDGSARSVGGSTP